MKALETARSALLTITKAGSGASNHLAIHHVGVGIHLCAGAEGQCCQDECNSFFHVYSFVEKSLFSGIAEPRFTLHERQTGTTSNGLL
jgi:hypothetical protein